MGMLLLQKFLFYLYRDGACGSRTRPWGTQSSPSVMCVLGTELGSSGLAAVTLTPRTMVPAQDYIFDITSHWLFFKWQFYSHYEVWYVMWLYYSTSIFLFYTHHTSILLCVHSLWAKSVLLFIHIVLYIVYNTMSIIYIWKMYFMLIFENQESCYYFLYNKTNEKSKGHLFWACCNLRVSHWCLADSDLQEIEALQWEEWP